MRAHLAIVVLGCGHAAAPAATTQQPAASRSPLAGFDRSDLVAFRGADVIAYSLAGDKIAQLGTFVLSSGNATGDWADRDHLFVSSVGGREVVMITRDAAKHLAVPPPAELAAPKPAKHDEGLEAGDDGALVVTRGAATWSRCAWGYPYDGFQCEVWVHAQLWPSSEIRVEKLRLDPQAWTWPSAEPAQYTASKGEHAVTCKPPAGAKVIIEASGNDVVADAIWTSIEPPQLLVTYGQFGLDDLVVSKWTLHDGCAAKPIASGSAVAPGPDGLWLATEGGDDEKYVLRRGARVLGDVPTTSVAFRPREGSAGK